MKKKSVIENISGLSIHPPKNPYLIIQNASKAYPIILFILIWLGKMGLKTAKTAIQNKASVPSAAAWGHLQQVKLNMKDSSEVAPQKWLKSLARVI